MSNIDKVLVFLYLSFASLFVYGLSTPLGNFRFSRFFLIVLFSRVLLRKISGSAFDVRVLDIWIFTFGLVASIFAVLHYSSSGGAFTYMGGLAECFLVYFIFRNYSSDLSIALNISRIYVYSAIPSIIIAFWQMVNLLQGNFDAALVPFADFVINIYERADSISAFGIAGSMSRLSSATNEPNVFGIYMVTVVLLSLSFIIRGFKLLDFSIFLISMVMVILTFSKSAYLSLLFGFFFINKRLFFKFIIPFVFVLLIAIYFLFPEMFESRFSLDVLDSGHVEHRVSSFGHLSWLGLGPGNFEIGSTHSLPLTFGVIYGVFGWGIYLFLLSTLAVLYYKSNRFSTYDRGLWACLFSVFIGLNLYDYFLYYYFWLFCAFAVKYRNSDLRGI